MLTGALNMVIFAKVLNFKDGSTFHMRLQESTFIILPLPHVVVQRKLGPICAKEPLKLGKADLLGPKVRLFLDCAVLGLVAEFGPKLALDRWQLRKGLASARRKQFKVSAAQAAVCDARHLVVPLRRRPCAGVGTTEVHGALMICMLALAAMMIT